MITIGYDWLCVLGVLWTLTLGVAYLKGRIHEEDAQQRKRRPMATPWPHR
jgi:hypothetical protein